jgi:hypothetical protein
MCSHITRRDLCEVRFRVTVADDPIRATCQQNGGAMLQQDQQRRNAAARSQRRNGSACAFCMFHEIFSSSV